MLLQTNLCQRSLSTLSRAIKIQTFMLLPSHMQYLGLPAGQCTGRGGACGYAAPLLPCATGEHVQQLMLGLLASVRHTNLRQSLWMHAYGA